MSFPDFIIIGAMKCGTSTLHEQLATQPGFFMSEPKEPNFFSDDDVFAKGADWYQALFANAGPSAIKGEASTHYTKLPTHPHTVERLAATAPDAKLIYVMRDPVDRLVSHYIHEWTMGVISEPIDAAIAVHPELIAYSRYAYQLEPWLARFGGARILPVFFERMTAHPDEELQRVAKFLGASDDVHWRTDLKAKNVSAERIRRFPGYDLIVENRVSTFLRRALAPRWLRDRMKSTLQMRERPQLSETTLAAVTTTFNEDLATLGAALGAPLTCKGFKETVSARALEWTKD